VRGFCLAWGLPTLDLLPPALGFPDRGSAQVLPLCGAASRIGPGPLCGSLTPPRCWEGSCAAPSMAPTHSHLHTHRRLWLQGTSTWFLLSLSEACSVRSLARLGELVEDVLHQRWRDQPPVALDPEMLSLLPY